VPDNCVKLKVTRTKNKRFSKAHLIFLLRHSYFFPVAAFNRIAASCIIVELLDALSHVIWPACIILTNENSYTTQAAYLVLNANPFHNFEEGLTKPLAVVCVVESREAEKAALDLPLRGHRLLNPMARYSKVPIGIASLPRVTCHINFANDGWTLDKE
jgi:hypothetical protein